ncbi:MAG: preprotein translocase subunit SecY [Oscillospiraceae bacterium]|nr:preprotein translocase subunit SecY [Oscillospiraceae bacterium]
MFKTIKNAFKTPDVRKRLLFTLLLVVIFRFGSFLTVPGVNSLNLEEFTQGVASGITGLIDLISGGARSRFSIFAMSITPYITASIVIQLLGMVIPSLEKLMKEGGEEGKAKINKYTKILTLVLAFVEAVGIYLTNSNSFAEFGLFVNPGFGTGALVVLSLVTGTALLMWLGEQITNKGIGNGISVIIFTGIISGLPGVVTTLYNLIMAPVVGAATRAFSTTGFLMSLAIIAGAIVLVAAVVFVQQAERRVPVQYAKKVVGRKMYGGQNTHIPMKLAMAGVIPVIFASSFITFPAIIIQMFNANIHNATGFWAMIYNFSLATSTSQVAIGYTIANAVVYFLLILGFTYFYTYATFNPAEVSNNIKKNGGFIPGIRAGKPTTEYLSNILSKITLFGGIFLSVIAILPMLMRFTNLGNVAFGGTSILIVVGVALETVQQLESRLVMRHYKGFLE